MPVPAVLASTEPMSPEDALPAQFTAPHAHQPLHARAARQTTTSRVEFALRTHAHLPVLRAQPNQRPALLASPRPTSAGPPAFPAHLRARTAPAQLPAAPASRDTTYRARPAQNALLDASLAPRQHRAPAATTGTTWQELSALPVPRQITALLAACRQER